MIWTGEASIVEIGISAGMLVGGMILGRWGGIQNRGREIIGSVILVGTPVIVSGLLPPGGFWCFVLCCVIIGISIPFYNGPLTALMQERIDPEDRQEGRRRNDAATMRNVGKNETFP
ncbi:MAG: hypothetical protein J6E42_05615 [Firmicutes bacterium]|nr:hypothetical protein [Bacillota bacterium]